MSILRKISVSAALAAMLVCGACSAKGNSSGADTATVAEAPASRGAAFSADSAYAFVERQVAFGPRVPNTEAHRRAGDWLASRLRESGASVTEQRMRLRAFDGTMLDARNILGRYNPDSSERVLLLAHWDCRPWADEDPDPALRDKPVDGANDGASGVGVLLEIARQLGLKAPEKGVDILFVDAEDWGSAGDEESWALGARYFVENPPEKGYSPRQIVLLDMVGGENALFHREYFSEVNAPGLNDALWHCAARLGYGDRFINRIGTAVTDDHTQFIAAGYPAIDIIEYYPGEGGSFNPRWHTSRDNMEGISAATLGIVGTTVMTWLRENY